MTELRIRHQRIGRDEPVFIIAEIGVNHDGNPDCAIQLVEAAAQAGADAVKFQIFHAGTLMHVSGEFAEYQKRTCLQDDPVQMLRQYELSQSDLQVIVQHASDLGLIPLATPFSIPDVSQIAALNLPAVKIASPDIVNRPLLKAATATGRPMILSTGAATLSEVDQCVQWLSDWKVSFALLHCISSYPTPSDQAHLCWIGEMARRFNVPIGYSDHTTEVMAGGLAVAAGARILEKHLTYDCKAVGPDHAASADPEMFARYVRFARQAQTLTGHSGKRVIDIERDVRSVSRQSLVACHDISANQIITEADLQVQRPGTGIPAADMENVIGTVAIRPIVAGTMLQWDMLDGRREVGHAA